MPKYLAPRPSLFWQLHVAGWLVYGLAMYLAGAAHMGWYNALLHKIPFIGLGFLITLLLRTYYRRCWARQVSFVGVVLRSIVSSYLLAQIWAACFNVVLWMIFERDTSNYPWYFFIAGSVGYTFVFLSWSALYFSIKHYQALQQQKVETSAAHALAHEAQLRMLRYQLNPHFLFNALNSIHALIREDQARAEKMLDELSEFLRYTLVQDKVGNVLLSEEVEAIRNYLDIEKIRFEDKLDVAIHVEEKAKTAQIPGFLIHPLVENAIKHGMETSPLPLRIRIDVTQPNGKLHIRVSNTGHFNDYARGDGAAPKSTGTGLANIRDRLTKVYPDRHRFRVVAKEDWVHAEIEVPG